MNPQIEKLIKMFAKLPRVGSRAAQRIVLALLQDKTGRANALSEMLSTTANTIHPCKICGVLTDKDTYDYYNKPVVEEKPFTKEKLTFKERLVKAGRALLYYPEDDVKEQEINKIYTPKLEPKVSKGSIDPKKSREKAESRKQKH